MAKLRAVFFGGDIWDNTVPFNSPVLHSFFPFWYALVKWAHRNNISIRVLRGTPLHDRDQDETVAAIVKASGVEVDYKYVPDLSIEYMESMKLHVLYVPDECRSNAQQIQDDVDELLREHGLQQTDIAIMHGMFEHQLGTIPMNSKVLSTEFFLSRVKYFINIGHIHTPSQQGRILAQGSFGRTAHGQEHPKGAFLLKEETPFEWIPIFVENKNAKIYKTIKIAEDVEDALKEIDREVSPLPKGSHVRVTAISSHPVFKGWDVLKAKYPFFTWKKDPVADEASKKKKDSVKLPAYTGIPLNRDTLPQAIHEEVSLMEELSPVESKRLYDILQELNSGGN